MAPQSQGIGSISPEVEGGAGWPAVPSLLSGKSFVSAMRRAPKTPVRKEGLGPGYHIVEDSPIDHISIGGLPARPLPIGGAIELETSSQSREVPWCLRQPVSMCRVSSMITRTWRRPEPRPPPLFFLHDAETPPFTILTGLARDRYGGQLGHRGRRDGARTARGWPGTSGPSGAAAGGGGGGGRGRRKRRRRWGSTTTAVPRGCLRCPLPAIVIASADVAVARGPACVLLLLFLSSGPATPQPG